MKSDKIDNKKKRIQKKLFLGEYAIHGFELQFTHSMNDDEELDFFNSFLEMIESRNLCCGGGVGGMFICSNNRYVSVTEEDIKHVTQWLEKTPSIANISVGKRVDANYGI